MGKKCICQICSCGRHRCPHNPTNNSRVINKTEAERCKVSEYEDVFTHIRPKRGPFIRPKDLLLSKGNIDLTTISKEDYVTQPLPEKKVKEPVAYIPPSGTMDIDSEYHSNFQGEISPPAKIPQFLRSVTQKIPSGKMQGNTTTKMDYRKHSTVVRSMPVSRGNKYTPPKSPFTYTSIHRADFQRFNEPKRPTGRQPDKIDMKGLPMELETSHCSEFKRHSIKKNEIVRRSDEYDRPSGPFDGDSLMHTDYVWHADAKKAKREKPVTTVFKTNDQMERTTTNLEDFKGWSVEAPRPKPKQQFQQPEGKMYLNPISTDYKYFGIDAKPAKSARPKTKLRTGRDGAFCGTSNYAADFKPWMSLPAIPIKLQDELTTLSPRKTKFDANSEHRESYKRFNTAPARTFKPGTHVFKTEDAMANRTTYNCEFDGKPPPQCPSERILKGDIANIRFEEDFDTGHRYVIGAIDSKGSREDSFVKSTESASKGISSIDKQNLETNDGTSSHFGVHENTAIAVN